MKKTLRRAGSDWRRSSEDWIWHTSIPLLHANGGAMGIQRPYPQFPLHIQKQFLYADFDVGHRVSEEQQPSIGSGKSRRGLFSRNWGPQENCRRQISGLQRAIAKTTHSPKPNDDEPQWRKGRRSQPFSTRLSGLRPHRWTDALGEFLAWHGVGRTDSWVPLDACLLWGRPAVVPLPVEQMAERGRRPVAPTGHRRSSAVSNRWPPTPAWRR